MDENILRLDKLLESLKDYKFEPMPFYNEAGHQIEYYTKDECGVAHYIDKYLTVIRSEINEDEIIGIVLRMPRKEITNE